jgi:hypothetical protein
MNSNNPLQTQPEIGNDYYYAASAVSPNAHHQDKKSSLFSIDRVAELLPNAAQTLEDQHFEEPESQQPFFDCLTQYSHRKIRHFLLLGDWKIIAMKLIYLLLWQQFNILRLLLIQMNFPLTLKVKMMIVFPSFRTLQRPPSS